MTQFGDLTLPFVFGDEEDLRGSAAVNDLLTDLLRHRRTDDTENNAILDAFIGALSDTMARLSLVAFGLENIEGNRMLKDPAVAPLWALAHAALYTGARLPGRQAGEELVDYTARARSVAVSPLGIKRGTHEAIRRTVQPLLTGSKTVLISDNYGQPYAIFVRTFEEETPDPALVEERLAGSYVSGGTPGAIRAELLLVYVAGDYPAWLEATVAWEDVPPDTTWANLTMGDVT